MRVSIRQVKIFWDKYQGTPRDFKSWRFNSGLFTAWCLFLLTAARFNLTFIFLAVSDGLSLGPQ